MPAGGRSGGAAAGKSVNPDVKEAVNLRIRIRSFAESVSRKGRIPGAGKIALPGVADGQRFRESVSGWRILPGAARKRPENRLPQTAKRGENVARTGLHRQKTGDGHAIARAHQGRMKKISRAVAARCADMASTRSSPRDISAGRPRR